MDGVHFDDGLVPYAVGEKIIMRASVREAGMDNGDLGTVRGVSGAVLHVEREDGRIVAIDTRTEAGAMIQHGYFCPSPRKVRNADLRPELLTKHAFCSKCPRRSAAERRIPARFLTDPTGEMSKVIARRLIEKR